jgi:hypothetical protein
MRYLQAVAILLLAGVHMSAAELTFAGVQNAGPTFVYEGFLPNNQRLEAGNVFVIYDVNGLLSGTGPDNWQFITRLNAPGLINEPLIKDAVFTYQGPAILGEPGETPLGTFYLNGAFSGQRQGVYLTQTVRVGSGNNTDTLLEESDTITVPEVPEPGTACLLVTGFLAIAQRCVRRRLGAVHTETAVR